MCMSPCPDIIEVYRKKSIRSQKILNWYPAVGVAFWLTFFMWCFFISSANVSLFLFIGTGLLCSMTIIAGTFLTYRKHTMQVILQNLERGQMI